MHYFVTGASGWIGSAVTTALLEQGHDVTGLARSDESAARIAAAGARVHRGELDDLGSLRSGAETADGVVHLGFNHDFSDYAGAGRTERAAVETFGEVLAGSGRPLLVAAGIAGITPGRTVTEDDRSENTAADAPRGASESLAFSFADRGIRAVGARFAPTVHGEGDHGFVAALVQIARAKGVAGYIGDGSHRWPAVHRSDAAREVVLGLANAPAGTAIHAIAEEGIPTRLIAEAIGSGLGLPVESIDPAAAADHFGWLGRIFGADLPASSALTRERLGWNPTGPTLLEDLEAGYYFRG